jgi:hypothetical protein
MIRILALFAQARAEPLPPVAQSIKAEETAILLVDFQNNFVSPDGAWYGRLSLRAELPTCSVLAAARQRSLLST